MAYHQQTMDALAYRWVESFGVVELQLENSFSMWLILSVGGKTLDDVLGSSLLFAITTGSVSLFVGTVNTP